MKERAEQNAAKLLPRPGLYLSNDGTTAHWTEEEVAKAAVAIAEFEAEDYERGPGVMAASTGLAVASARTMTNVTVQPLAWMGSMATGNVPSLYTEVI